MYKNRRRIVLLFVAAFMLPGSGCIDAVTDGITVGITTGLSAVVQQWIESTLENLMPG